MKTLNLASILKSDLKYVISRFPDGQQNIVVSPTIDIYKVTIISRLNNWKDLEIIVAAVASLRELGSKEIHLYTPYFLGARSDRKFEEGGNWYLKDVICPIINSLNFESVAVLDAHSWVLGNLLDNYIGVDNEDVVKLALGEIYDKDSNDGNDRLILVSPDAGAIHKLAKIKEQIELTSDILVCSKERGTDGKLSKTVVPISLEHHLKDFIIVDDICDGGRTFINIAEEIKSSQLKSGITNPNKIYLIVTHGIFSAGFTELSKHFDGIYCTNSYSDTAEYQHTGERLLKTKVHQLNIF
jgi:ribose-phosphate pyrophosphokinase